MSIHKGSTGPNLSWSDSHHLMNKIFPAKFPIAPLGGGPPTSYCYLENPEDGSRYSKFLVIVFLKDSFLSNKDVIG